MRNKLFSLMCVLAISLSSWAQTSLKGRVIDEATQTPVVGAKVTLANQNISTTTNAAGEFSLLYLEATDEEVLIEADGYVAGLELITLQADQSNTMDDIALQQDIVTQAQDEILLNLTEEEMTDDEGRSQSQASSSSASSVERRELLHRGIELQFTGTRSVQLLRHGRSERRKPLQRGA